MINFDCVEFIRRSLKSLGLRGCRVTHVSKGAGCIPSLYPVRCVKIKQTESDRLFNFDGLLKEDEFVLVYNRRLNDAVVILKFSAFLKFWALFFRKLRREEYERRKESKQ